MLHDQNISEIFKFRKNVFVFRGLYENREVLANLKTDSNKTLTLSISEEIQPLTKCFGTLLSVILVSFHLK